MRPISEFERRRLAVQQVREGRPAAVVARELERSERWIHKWLRRFEGEGEAGLVERSRAPKSRPTVTPPDVVDKILAVRDDLEHSEFGGVSADAILYELECEGFEPVVSRATVNRILKRSGVTARPGRDRRAERHRPRPRVNRPGVWQQADWVGPRYLGRRLSFSSLHLIDVGGGAVAGGQYPTQQLTHAVEFFTERAWPTLGIPWSLQVDGAFSLALPDRPAALWNVFVRTCLFFGVEVIITPPNELGWQNHIESFNNLWQERTLRRHFYDTVTDVEAASERFCDYYNHKRPHPALSVKTHGTRFPAELLETHHPNLRFPPQGFSPGDYQDRRGRLRLPLANGRLTFLTRVKDPGVINVAGHTFSVPPATTGACTVATILTSRQQLVVRLDGEIIAQHCFPITEKPVSPYHPIARRGLYYTIKG